MFEVTVAYEFSAAHHLRGYAGNCEAHHGHNWEVEVTVRGPNLNETGILIDFRDLKNKVRLALEDLDHSDLNQNAAFQALNPTSENLARFIFQRMAESLRGSDCRVNKVCVRETARTMACYWEDEDSRRNRTEKA